MTAAGAGVVTHRASAHKSAVGEAVGSMADVGHAPGGEGSGEP